MGVLQSSRGSMVSFIAQDRKQPVPNQWFNAERLPNPDADAKTGNPDAPEFADNGTGPSGNGPDSRNTPEDFRRPNPNSNPIAINESPVTGGTGSSPANVSNGLDPSSGLAGNPSGSYRESPPNRFDGFDTSSKGTDSPPSNAGDNKDLTNDRSRLADSGKNAEDGDQTSWTDNATQNALGSASLSKQQRDAQKKLKIKPKKKGLIKKGGLGSGKDPGGGFHFNWWLIIKILIIILILFFIVLILMQNSNRGQG